MRDQEKRKQYAHEYYEAHKEEINKKSREFYYARKADPERHKKYLKDVRERQAQRTRTRRILMGLPPEREKVSESERKKRYYWSHREEVLAKHKAYRERRKHDKSLELQRQQREDAIDSRERHKRKVAETMAWLKEKAAQIAKIKMKRSAII